MYTNLSCYIFSGDKPEKEGKPGKEGAHKEHKEDKKDKKDKDKDKDKRKLYTFEMIFISTDIVFKIRFSIFLFVNLEVFMYHHA